MITRAPHVDIESKFPFLLGRGMEAIRLHPRRAEGLPPESSKFGGTFLLPKGEDVPTLKDLDCKAIPVLQLAKSDFPTLKFPGDADLLQLMWFTEPHQDCYLHPKVIAFWRRIRELDPANSFSATIQNGRKFLHLYECAVHPEKVIEYPYMGTLTTNEVVDIENWEQMTGINFEYSSLLSVCPGSKLGGYINWGGDDPRPPLPMGAAQPTYLCTITDTEWDALSEDRWRPLEEDCDNDPLGVYLKIPLNVFLAGSPSRDGYQDIAVC